MNEGPANRVFPGTLRRPGDLFDLTGRTVVIAGGGGGIARESAHTFALAGARVALLDADQEKARQNATEVLSEVGVEPLVVPCDVTSDGSISDAFAEVAREVGVIDAFVYAVMAKPEGYYSSVDAYTRDTWHQVSDANTAGAFFSSREAMRLMKGSGSIVLISSIYALVGPDPRIYEGCDPQANIYGGGAPLSLPIPYSASKAGVVGLSRHLATVWARQGIRVNALVPGGVFAGQEDAFVEAYAERTPLGRMATWSDYNGPLLFLTSHASRYMTGATLVVDGGWTSW